MEKRAARIKAPALLHGSFTGLKKGEKIDLLFWSGGKDSFLAARALRREHEGSCDRMLFVTTFGGGSRTVAHQEVAIEQIVRQAATLRVPLLGIPLWPHTPYAERIGEAFGLISSAGIQVGRVCSGDLHLEEVARWRRERIGPAVKELGASIYAPLWNVSYDELLADLDASGTPCTVCALGDHSPLGPLDIKIGEPFNAALLEMLPAHVDRFGENGEFHTLAEVWNAASEDPLS
jgi:ATP-binding cassette subfamily B (MDR/TAP) protein 1